MNSILEKSKNLVMSGLSVLRQMPPIFRYLCTIIIGIGVSIFLLALSACGNMSKISIKSNPDNISISVTQNSNDSTAVNVNVNPTLRLYEKQEDEAKTWQNGKN